MKKNSDHSVRPEEGAHLDLWRADLFEHGHGRRGVHQPPAHQDQLGHADGGLRGRTTGRLDPGPGKTDHRGTDWLWVRKLILKNEKKIEKKEDKFEKLVRKLIGKILEKMKIIQRKINWNKRIENYEKKLWK